MLQLHHTMSSRIMSSGIEQAISSFWPLCSTSSFMTSLQQRCVSLATCGIRDAMEQWDSISLLWLGWLMYTAVSKPSLKLKKWKKKKRNEWIFGRQWPSSWPWHIYGSYRQSCSLNGETSGTEIVLLKCISLPENQPLNFRLWWRVGEIGLGFSCQYAMAKG